MRPPRAFIMPRSTPRDSRKTADRFVSTTAFQSSSFIRIASVSCVMPALLTRMSRRPDALWIDAMAASQAAASLTSSTMPRPPLAASASPIAAAPASDVAVPTTVAPRAASVVRDRAADAARRAGDERDLSSQRGLPRDVAHGALPASPASRIAASAASSDAGSKIDMPVTRGSMRLQSGASTLPGPHSTTCVTPASAMRRTISTQRTGDDAWRISASRMRSGSCSIATSTLLTTSIAGAPIATFLRWLASRSPAGFSSDEWNGAETGSDHRALRAARLRGLARALDRRLVPGDDDLCRRVEVDRLDDLALRRFVARRAHRVVVEAEDRGHAAGPDRHRVLHRLRAEAHQRQRVGERQHAGRDERRVFAEAVAREHRRLRGRRLGATRATSRRPR